MVSVPVFKTIILHFLHSHFYDSIILGLNRKINDGAEIILS